jgi:hypothetical protein
MEFSAWLRLCEQCIFCDHFKLGSSRFWASSYSQIVEHREFLSISQPWAMGKKTLSLYNFIRTQSKKLESQRSEMKQNQVTFEHTFQNVWSNLPAKTRILRKLEVSLLICPLPFGTLWCTCFTISIWTSEITFHFHNVLITLKLNLRSFFTNAE